MNRVGVGKRVEEGAVSFLNEKLQKRFVLLSRNYATCRGEVDVVFEHVSLNGERELVFLEVRFRSKNSFCSGLESVSPKKRQRLISAANHYLASYSGIAQEIRFDVMDWDGEEWTWVRSAWDPA
jgi:putative endonuclease